ncbi:uncharacterized protein LOC127841388 isoform X2 [Dreissena polymorpha]|nr:uncharacterized protein LOC127841388 isoform X2 [Dreissena polymorpha]
MTEEEHSFTTDKLYGHKTEVCSSPKRKMSENIGESVHGFEIKKAKISDSQNKQYSTCYKKETECNVEEQQHVNQDSNKDNTFTVDIVDNSDENTENIASDCYALEHSSNENCEKEPVIRSCGNNSCQNFEEELDDIDKKAAEDIVRKLCKNGKLMEFQEGDDFIKVIVYEDSQEEENTESADEGNQPVYVAEPAISVSSQALEADNKNRYRKPAAQSTPVTSKERNLSQKMILPNPTSSFQSSVASLPDPLPNGRCPQLYTTPHPRNGYMFYSSEALQSRLPYQSEFTPTSARMTTPVCKPVLLNSSGEEVSPNDPLAMPSQQEVHDRVRSLMTLPQFDIEDSGKIREQHNQKERRRRARIKEACNLLRQLVPGMSDKTDKATVFEFAARYVHFLKAHTGAQYDKDFLMKYSPY